MLTIERGLPCDMLTTQRSPIVSCDGVHLSCLLQGCGCLILVQDLRQLLGCLVQRGVCLVKNCSTRTDTRLMGVRLREVPTLPTEAPALLPDQWPSLVRCAPWRCQSYGWRQTLQLCRKQLLYSACSCSHGNLKKMRYDCRTVLCVKLLPRE